MRESGIDPRPIASLAPFPTTRRESAKTRNLVLVHAPRFQAYADFETIKKEIEKLDGSIGVHIAFDTLRNERLMRRLGSEPTLIVSFSSMRKFKTDRGRICAGRSVDKLMQMQLLADRGIPVPKTVPLIDGYVPQEKEWGEFVLLKPSFPRSMHGHAIELIRTRNVRYRPPEQYPEDHPARLGVMSIQQYVHTGSMPSHYRVLTLFGAPLYCLKGTRSDGAPIDLAADDEALARVSPTSNIGRRRRELADDPDVLALARAVDAVCPDVPLKGIDIVREEKSGRLYVLEFNPGGNTWHFSSIAGVRSRLELGEFLGAPPDRMEEVGRSALIAQFYAYRTAARVLVERTLSHAL